MLKERKIFLDRRVKLQGYAVGYEILQAGEVVKKVIFDQPVKNLVVDSGKDFFCAPHFGGGAYSSGNTTGNPLTWATRYMARGSGSTPSAAGMTNLEAQIGNRTNNLLTGDPNTGVRYDKSTGIIYLRKTYDSEIETSNQNINEVGFFTDAVAGTMFSRIVLPSTVTVLIDQQLRLTYELQVTIGPISPTPCAPTITGWITDGDAQLEGYFPNTSATFGSEGNQFIGVWDTNGNSIYRFSGSPDPGRGLLLLEPSRSYYGGERMNSLSEDTTALVGPVFAFDSKTFSAFGTVFPQTSAGAGVYVADQVGSNSPGSFGHTLAAYTPGTGYRDRTIVFETNWPSVAITPIAIRFGGLTHIFDAPVSKTTLQRLTLTLRISIV